MTQELRNGTPVRRCWTSFAVSICSFLNQAQKVFARITNLISRLGTTISIVVIFSTGHRKPSVVWLEPPSRLILACDMFVHKVDLAAKKVEYSKRLDGVFYEFLSVERTGACTVLHEIGIVSIEPDGTNKWVVITGIIEDFQRNGADSIDLKIMDEEPKAVNLRTGEVKP